MFKNAPRLLGAFFFISSEKEFNTLKGLVNFLEEHMLSCSYKKFLGIDCPGCGFQRSLILLLEGEFAESFRLFPALIPILFMFIFLFLHLIIKFRSGAKVLLTLFVVNIAIMITNFILKLTL